MWVPHKEFKKKNKKPIEEGGRTEAKNGREVFFYFFFFSYVFLIFKENRPSEFVGINTESALRDEGYA